MSIENRIKMIRGSLTQKRFAEKIGVHIGTVQLYETGNIPKGDVLQRICENFGVNINWLLTGKGKPCLHYLNDMEKVDVTINDQAPFYGLRKQLGEKNGDETPGAERLNTPIHEDFKLSEALTMAARVLESHTSYAGALYLNIQHFDRAIAAEKRIAQLEEKDKQLEERISLLEKKLLELNPSQICRDGSCEKRVA